MYPQKRNELWDQLNDTILEPELAEMYNYIILHLGSKTNAYIGYDIFMELLWSRLTSFSDE